MQVAHAQDHVTHAFLGAKQSRAVGISDDPAFFQILSSTLYQNQKLAVVRETLCNAWDAHIEAGKIDTPIEITIDEEEMFIRDFGHGIPDDLMQPIYGVYGASTKKSNKNVTGGFGLGCKAPWSYTEHFEVTSFNGGTKTIYTMTRSSAEVGGRPDITPIASFPTTETGLQVKIPLVSSYDQGEFTHLVMTVVRNGEIMAKLNGKLLDVLPFSKAQLDYIIAPKSMFSKTINVRYGNVIYPVDLHHPKLAKLLERVGLCRDLNSNPGACIILQAPADSLSITPSRETLSMTDQTKETLNQLMNDAYDLTMAQVDKYVKDITQEYVANLKPTPENLFDTTSPILRQAFPAPKNFLTTIEDVAQAIVHRSFWNYSSPSTEELAQRTRLLQKLPGYDKNLIKAYRHAMRMDEKNEPRRHYKQPRMGLNFWLYSNIVSPVNNALKSRNLNPTKFQLSLGNWFTETKAIDLDRPIDATYQEAYPLLRKFVVLAFNKTDIQERLPRFPEIKTSGGVRGVFTYQVPRSFTRMTALREAFVEAGMNVIDLTVAHPWENNVTIAPMVREKRDTKNGLPTLKGLWSGIELVVPSDPLCSNDVKERTSTPTYVVQLARGKTVFKLGDFDETTTRLIIEAYGSDTGVVTSSTQLQAWIKKGAKDLTTHVQGIVLQEYKTNPRIRHYVAYSFKRVPYIGYNLSGLLQNCREIPEVQKIFGLSSKPTANDYQVIRIAEALTILQSRYDTSDFRKEFDSVVDAIPVNKEFKDFLLSLNRNDLLHSINLTKLTNLLKSREPETAKKAVSILKIAVKG